jgi:hypothetical protein
MGKVHKAGERSEHPLHESDKPAYRQVGDKQQVTKANFTNLSKGFCLLFA